ncbi:MAG: iron-containing alcohol dehydrogenase [Firmicutes bacterium]|nr:iron-containing alcohol dehydrogenase [Bacillota bacterium]HPU01801.1 iron-containing alcohol dehydrogenase [Bacillota bacterium]
MILSTRQFHFSYPVWVEFGCGISRRVHEKAASLHRRRALVVSDAGVARAGLLEPIMASLEGAGLQATLFTGVESDPCGEICDRVAALAGEHAGDSFFVAVGGGSVMDTVKAAVVVAGHGGSALDYQRGGKKIEKSCPPYIAIPTTAGTGAEVSPYAVISDPSRKKKVVLEGPQLWPRFALLDPELTLGLPPRITAETGMDALTNVVEAYTSTGTDPFAQALALKGAAMIGRWLRKAVAQPHNLEARSNMLVASMFGGLCFDYAGLGAVHACSHPLGAHFGLSHGLATAVMLPAVMEFNLMACPELYRDLAAALGADVRGMDLMQAASAAPLAVRRLMEDIGLPRTLRELDIPEETLSLLAREAMQERANLCTNPRVPDEGQMLDIFYRAYYGPGGRK